MDKAQYNSYREVYYEDATACIAENLVDESIRALSLDPAAFYENIGGLSGTIKKCLWFDLGIIILQQKPSPAKTGTNAGAVSKHANDLLKTLKAAHQKLSALHYNNLSQLSSEYAVSERMRQKSNLKSQSPRVQYSEGYGIWLVQQQKREVVHLYPFDKELDETLNGLSKILSYLQDACPEFEKEKSTGKGKARLLASDDIIVSLCRIYKNYTRKIPHATTSGGSLSNTRQINGQVISFLKLILPHTLYERKSDEEALQKIIERLERDGQYPDIWSDI